MCHQQRCWFIWSRWGSREIIPKKHTHTDGCSISASMKRLRMVEVIYKLHTSSYPYVFYRCSIPINWQLQVAEDTKWQKIQYIESEVISQCTWGTALPSTTIPKGSPELCVTPVLSGLPGATPQLWFIEVHLLRLRIWCGGGAGPRQALGVHVHLSFRCQSEFNTEWGNQHPRLKLQFCRSTRGLNGWNVGSSMPTVI